MATKKKVARAGAYKRAMQAKTSAGMGKSRSPAKKKVTIAGLAGPKRKKAARARLRVKGHKT